MLGAERQGYKSVIADNDREKIHLSATDIARNIYHHGWMITERVIKPKKTNYWYSGRQRVKKPTSVSITGASAAATAAASSSGSSTIVLAVGPGASFSFVGASA
jgi:hypothetical protein